MSAPGNAMDTVVFFRPEHTQETLRAVFPGFDPDIPLPLRLPPGVQKPEENGALREQISVEGILAGILSVFAWDPENPDKAYYQEIAGRIRPGLRGELSEAALIKIRNGDLELAEEIFRALKGMNPGDREATLNLALLYEQKAGKLAGAGKGGEAEQALAEAGHYYRESMAFDPPLPESFFNAGYFFLRTKEYKRAEEAFRTYCTLETKTDETAGVRKEKAERLLREIRENHLTDGHFRAACEAIRCGDEERGLEEIRFFLESRPKVWNAWFLLGWGLRRLERWQEAKQAFLQALELRRETDREDDLTPGEGLADICNEIAICTMEEGSLEESRKWLYAALEADPENTKIISNLGAVAWKAGNLQEAESFFRAAVEINPDDGTAALLLQQLKNSKKS